MKERLFMEVGAQQHLVPADPFTAELIDTKLKPGARYKVSVVSDRSRGELNLYWAGLSLLHENLDEEERKLWATTEDLSKMLLHALSHVDREYYPHPETGEITFVERAKSIALDNMEEAVFKDYFELARSIVLARWGTDYWQLWLDGRPPDAFWGELKQYYNSVKKGTK